MSRLLCGLYEPESFFDRAFRSLEVWQTARDAEAARLCRMSYNLRVLSASMWTQGVRSGYRRAYWRFLGQLIWKWSRQDQPKCGWASWCCCPRIIS